MKRSADIVILGAGPAGSRAAELLRRCGADVLLLDPKAPWEKPCGGGLTPAAFEEIPELGGVRTHARPVSVVRVELGSDEGFLVELERPMWILPRRKLARWQLERAVGAGARHLAKRARSIERRGREWRVDTGEGTFRSPFLVGADGAASLTRRVVAPLRAVELAPTRVAYPREDGPAPDVAVLKFYRGFPGYAWDFPRPDHHSVGIVVPAGSWGREAMDGEIDDYDRSIGVSGDAGLLRAGAVIGTAQYGHGDYSWIGSSDFALLGDAAGLADPLTGEGIQNALRSATLLAQAWGSGDVRRYPSLVRAEFGIEFAVARFLRRSLYETEAGAALVRRAIDSTAAYAAVHALLNALNEHDGSPMGLGRRWLHAWSRARRLPSMVGPRSRMYLAPGGRPTGGGERADRAVPAA